MNTKQILWLVALISFTSYAQETYVPGYIISLEGDTIRGELLEQSSYVSYSSCQFRADGQALEEYLPGDIRGYRYEGKKLYDSQVKDGIFMEGLVVGKISLFTDGDDFYLKKDNEIYPLSGGYLNTKIEGKAGVKEDHRWRGTISVLIGDCLQNSNELVSKTLIQEKSLVKLISRYNTCQGELYYSSHKLNDHLPKMVLQLGVLTGVNYSRVRPSIESGSYRTNLLTIFQQMDDSNPATHWSLGMSLNVFLPRALKKTAVFSQIIFSQLAYEAGTLGGESDYFSTYSYRTLSIPIGIKSYSGNGQGFLAEFLINNEFLFSSKTTHYQNEASGPRQISPSPIDFKNYQFALSAGAGFYKEFERFQMDLFARAMYTNFSTNIDGFSATHLRFSVNCLISLPKPEY